MHKNKTRRQFLNSMVGVTGITALAQPKIYGRTSAANDAITVQQVIDLFIKEVPGAPFPKTVDTLKSGDPNQVVTGIVTTMFATVEVIRKAASQGANFIIAHEPTFYNHNDDTGWLENDPVYQYKKAILQKHGVA